MDPIANMITALKNAGDAGLERVSLPHSQMKEGIAKVLKSEGFISGFEVKEERGKKKLVVSLLAEAKRPRIRGIKRISKSSKRVYKKSSELRPVKSGYGVLVVTTPKGIMSGKEARRAGVGGEALFTIW